MKSVLQGLSKINEDRSFVKFYIQFQAENTCNLTNLSEMFCQSMCIFNYADKTNGASN